MLAQSADFSECFRNETRRGRLVLRKLTNRKHRTSKLCYKQNQYNII